MNAVPNFLREYRDLYARDPRGACKAWFREARYGLFLHYGLYSLLGRHEWVQYGEKIRPGDYAELAHCFDARAFDAGAIADFAVDCQMRYINITTRHHDGFCLFKSRHSTFNVIDASPCRRDLIGELAQACDQRGLGLCLYYSHGRDWKHPHAPNNDQFDGRARPEYDPPEPTYARGKAHDLKIYTQFMLDQITELLTQYPHPIASIWLDGIMVPLLPRDAQGQTIKDYEPIRDGDPFECQKLYDHIHAISPYALVAYKQGYLGTEDYYAPERKAYNRFGQPFSQVLGEVCTTAGGGWGYTAGHDYCSADQLWQKISDARQAGCNLLMNIGPLPDGALPQQASDVLREVGRRLATQGFPGE